MHKAVVPEADGTFSDIASVRSGRSAKSSRSMVSYDPRRAQKQKTLMPQNMIVEVNEEEEDLESRAGSRGLGSQ